LDKAWSSFRFAFADDHGAVRVLADFSPDMFGHIGKELAEDVIGYGQILLDGDKHYFLVADF